MRQPGVTKAAVCSWGRPKLTQIHSAYSQLYSKCTNQSLMGNFTDRNQNSCCRTLWMKVKISFVLLQGYFFVFFVKINLFGKLRHNYWEKLPSQIIYLYVFVSPYLELILCMHALLGSLDCVNGWIFTQVRTCLLANWPAASLSLDAGGWGKKCSIRHQS